MTLASYNIDFDAASSAQIEHALCARLEQIRLSRNMTQKALAVEAGLSQRTIARLANGDGISLDTFVRVLMALQIHQNLAALLPDPTIRPVERIARGGHQRQRARAKNTRSSERAWTWGAGADPDD